MYKKRRFKPMQKRIVSLGMAAVMLMAVPSQSMLFHAKAAQSAQDEDVQDQSVESESGYRLYADELTSASGAVKGDVTEVLPGYEIINVKLPDGSLVNPEEVNFPVTESGDYVFEVIYNSASNDANPAKTAEIQDTAIQSADAQSTEGQVSEQGTEEQSISDVLPESAGDTESEELTLTVTLPEEEAETEETAEPASEETQSTESESQEITSRNSVAESLQSNSNISTRAGGFSSTGWASANKTWSASDFTTKYSYYSNGHMDYSGNPGSNTIVEVPLSPSYDSARGVQFTFGGQMGTVTNQAYWIQQGAAFSDITFDFTKDFALEGYMRIGDSFGCDGTTNPTNSDMQIDGGVTISFIPTNQIQASKINAALEKGGAYRLGAYGTLPNSIVCEFDTSTETYYNIGDSRNFHINEDDVQRTGDYYYLSDESAHAWYTLLNNSPNASDANWVQATWEKGAQWRIYAWTETNEATQDYSVLTDTTTDQILATAVDSKVPSVTTTMSMINKDDAGSLPTTMFSISQVQLTNKGDNNRVTDVRETTTISLTQVDGVTEPNEALHDYYYEVSVNETQYDRQNRPYTIMTQEVTGRSFWARYYRYNTLNGSYEDVTTDNLVLGNISYPSNGPDYPSSIRFGMWADKQETLANGLVTDKPFTGQANFKFTRRAIPE